MANKKPVAKKAENTAKTENTKTASKKFDWNKRIGKKEGTADYVKPAMGWGLIAGTLALATAIGLIVIL